MVGMTTFIAKMAERLRAMTVNSLGLPTHSFVKRLIGAASLNAPIYEEVEADRSAIGQATLVVVLSSIAAGIGARGFGASRPVDVVFFAGVALAGWIAWAALIYQIGTRLLPAPQTHADVGQLLRTIGFAATPGLFRVLGVVPGLAAPVFAITSLWMLAAMIVGVRQALDAQTGRAVMVCAVGWLLALALAVGLGVLFGPAVQ
jgi:hypothetical protein